MSIRSEDQNAALLKQWYEKLDVPVISIEIYLDIQKTFWLRWL